MILVFELWFDDPLVFTLGPKFQKTGSNQKFHSKFK
jgi:hypothetical protein